MDNIIPIVYFYSSSSKEPLQISLRKFSKDFRGIPSINGRHLVWTTFGNYQGIENPYLLSASRDTKPTDGIHKILVVVETHIPQIVLPLMKEFNEITGLDAKSVNMPYTDTDKNADAMYRFCLNDMCHLQNFADNNNFVKI